MFPNLNMTQMIVLVAVTAVLALALAWTIEERRIRSFMERLDERGVAAFQQEPGGDAAPPGYPLPPQEGEGQ